ncbi:hypothetical protein GUJ93_ZPchr0012g20369 [Zizania palustris]|uniref:Uncharacterized protein n=1 Tax=Zizania palustris TaxID=103762 RepID=A0A8J6BWH7_ZIZPA|nr:hypothetical protein GUJ93_ZPchr0012g20369 [Zizania palustris]
MACEPPPSSVPESSFPLLSLSLPVAKMTRRSTGVTGSSTPATDPAPVPPDLLLEALRRWRLHLHDPAASSAPFLPRSSLFSAAGRLDAAASTPVASSSLPPPLCSLLAGLRRLAASTFSSPFGGLAAVGAPAPFLVLPLLTTGAPSSWLPPLMAGLGRCCCGSLLPHRAAAALAVAPRDGSGLVLATAALFFLFTWSPPLPPRRPHPPSARRPSLASHSPPFLLSVPLDFAGGQPPPLTAGSAAASITATTTDQRYIEAILDAGKGATAAACGTRPSLLRERGHFSPARYFVEEVITSYERPTSTRHGSAYVPPARCEPATLSERDASPQERNTRLDNMTWRIWNLARRRKRLKAGDLGIGAFEEHWDLFEECVSGILIVLFPFMNFAKERHEFHINVAAYCVPCSVI